MAIGTGTDWQAWQRSWDRQQEWYMPDREDRFSVMLDLTEALVGPAPASSTWRAAPAPSPPGCSTASPEPPAPASTSTPHCSPSPRAPSPATTGSPRDGRPQGSKVAHPAAVRHVRRRADRHGPALAAQRTPRGPLRSARGTRPRRRCPHERRPHDRRDHAPDQRGRPGPAARPDGPGQETGALDWAEWWKVAAQDPVLAEPTARRFEIYGEHADGDTPSADWHARVLREKGFAEARAVWRSPSDALVLAVK